MYITLLSYLRINLLKVSEIISKLQVSHLAQNTLYLQNYNMIRIISPLLSPH